MFFLFLFNCGSADGVIHPTFLRLYIQLSSKIGGAEKKAS